MLIIAQKIKPNKIKLYRWAFDEIESYSLLKVSVYEAKELIRSDKNHWKTEIIHGVKEYVRNVSPDLQKCWLNMVEKHKNSNPDFTDVSKKYILKIPGTSCLIRDPNTHTIKISYRPKYDRYSNINVLYISDQVREKFFDEAHHSYLWKTEHKYGISIEDEKEYSKWSNYMNKCYIKFSKNI